MVQFLMGQFPLTFKNFYPWQMPSLFTITGAGREEWAFLGKIPVSIPLPFRIAHSSETSYLWQSLLKL